MLSRILIVIGALALAAVIGAAVLGYIGLKYGDDS